MRNDESLKSIPVIVISTSSHQADMDRAKALGARHYIVKPDSFDKLTERVKETCADLLADEATA